NGGVLWRTDKRRCATQFTLLTHAWIERSRRRRRVAVLLVDNAQSHRVGKTGMVRRFMAAFAGPVVLVFLPPYRPDLQPAERIGRQWRSGVTHSHRRATIDSLISDSDGWFERRDADPAAVLRALGDLTMDQPGLMAA